MTQLICYDFNRSIVEASAEISRHYQDAIINDGS